MFDYDALIIGGGPAGLTAGIYIGRAKRRVLILEKENLGGYVQNIELIENYPGFSEGVSGAHLSSEMIAQATKFGVDFRYAQVTEIEPFSSCIYVNCADGSNYTAAVVIISGGTKHKKLNVPGEEELRNKGVFNCAYCDGGGFSGKTVAVCGGGDAGVTEAIYMAKIADKVHLFECESSLSACPFLQEKLKNIPNVEVSCGLNIVKINGEEKVESIECSNSASGNRVVQPVDGVLISIGLSPATDYLKDVLKLNERGQIVVTSKMESTVPNIFAAGDIRSDSPGQITSAVGDGVIAAMSAIGKLQMLEE
jgi:thioredoxin reductase (NADPH)